MRISVVRGECRSVAGLRSGAGSAVSVSCANAQIRRSSVPLVFLAVFLVGYELVLVLGNLPLARILDGSRVALVGVKGEAGEQLQEVAAAARWARHGWVLRPNEAL